jgi:hypothetical protein
LSSQELDEAGDNPVNAIVSVLMLREGWDVQNVTVDWGTTRQQNDQNQRPTPRD